MKKKAIVFLISFLFCISIPVITHAFEGPLKVRNQFPLFLPADAPYLEQAMTESSFVIGLSHSSIYLVGNSTEWDMGLDMELTELNLRYRRNIRDFIEIGIDLPILSFNSGFMDGFLEGYHDAFGFPDYGRSDRPDNEFLYEVRRDGVLIIRGEGGHTGFGDMRLTLKKLILKEDPVISIRADIELPTGDAKKGYGNGSVDTGIAVMLDKNLGEKNKAYLNLGIAFPGDLKGHETVKLKKFVYGGAGIESEVWEHVSLLAQLFFQTSPYPDTDISEVDRTAVLFSLGGRYTSGNDGFEFSFTEDPNTAGAPDFTVNILYKRSL